MSRRRTTEFALTATIAKELETLADPERAVQQQAYMKSTMPYAGVGAPELRKLCRDAFKAQPPPDAEAWHEAVADLWRTAEVREMRHAAIELLNVPRFKKAWLAPDAVPLIREMVETGAWWDYVDTLASNVMGDLLRRFPEQITPLLYAWAEDEHLWVRRTAILAQLKFHEATDEALLVHAIEGSLHDSDFFARKAIGWALRQHSRTNPKMVIDYVNEHRDVLSPLSKREAFKLLLKDGTVDSVP